MNYFYNFVTNNNIFDILRVLIMDDIEILPYIWLLIIFEHLILRDTHLLKGRDIILEGLILTFVLSSIYKIKVWISTIGVDLGVLQNAINIFPKIISIMLILTYNTYIIAIAAKYKKMPPIVANFLTDNLSNLISKFEDFLNSDNDSDVVSNVNIDDAKKIKHINLDIENTNEQ